MRPLEQVLWQAFTWFGVLVFVLMLLALPLVYNIGASDVMVIPVTGEVVFDLPAAGSGEVCAGLSASAEACASQTVKQ
jgi:hypothetical protein